LGGSLKGGAFGDASSEGGHPQAALEAATRPESLAGTDAHEDISIV
jgi:hypothetical protein